MSSLNVTNEVQQVYCFSICPPPTCRCHHLGVRWMLLASSGLWWCQTSNNAKDRPHPQWSRVSDLAGQQLKVEKLVWIHVQIFSFSVTVDVALRHPDASVLQETIFLLIVRNLGQLIYDNIIQNRRRYTLDFIMHVNTTIYHSYLFRKRNNWLRTLPFQSRVSTVSSCLRFLIKPFGVLCVCRYVSTCVHMETQANGGCFSSDAI